MLFLENCHGFILQSGSLLWQGTEAVISLSQKPPDSFDKHSTFTLQNARIAGLPLPQLLSLLVLLCDWPNEAAAGLKLPCSARHSYCLCQSLVALARGSTDRTDERENDRKRSNLPSPKCSTRRKPSLLTSRPTPQTHAELLCESRRWRLRWNSLSAIAPKAPGWTDTAFSSFLMKITDLSTFTFLDIINYFLI